MLPTVVSACSHIYCGRPSWDCTTGHLAFSHTLCLQTVLQWRLYTKQRQSTNSRDSFCGRWSRNIRFSSFLCTSVYYCISGLWPKLMIWAPRHNIFFVCITPNLWLIGHIILCIIIIVYCVLHVLLVVDTAIKYCTGCASALYDIVYTVHILMTLYLIISGILDRSMHKINYL